MTVTSTPPPAPPPRSTRVGLVLRAAAVAAAALVAAELGVLATVFGLTWVVPVVAVGAMLAAAARWRRALVPLAVLACAACIPAALAHRQPTRIAPGIGGVETVVPTALEAGHTTYRHGLGPLLVDLRRTRLPRAGTMTLAARSDTNNVVVALPSDRCVEVTVRYRRLALPSGLASAALRAVGLPAAPPTAAVPTVDRFSRDAGAPSASALVMFGRVHPGAEEQQTFIRRTDRSDAVRLTLDVASPGTVVVRDFPTMLGRIDVWGTDPMAIAWPWDMLPQDPTPGDAAVLDGWTEPWTDAQRRRGTPQRWVRWLSRIVPQLRDNARVAAGPCAPFAVQADYWARADVDRGNADVLTLWVNGHGDSTWTKRRPNGVVTPADPLRVAP